MKQMRQWRITDEWSFDGLKMVEAEQPEPGPGEVLLKMKAVSLNYRDYLMVGRGYGKMSGELPLVPLSDGVGEVVALGDGVEDVAMGSRRLPCFIQNWYDGDLGPSGFSGALGGPLDGTAREYMAVPVASSVEVPDHFADIEAATLGCAAITAWNALAEMPKTVVGGGTVVTLGTGGVSLFALQLAKARGARVISTSSSEAKLERLRALGADETINYLEVPDWGKAVLGLTDGLGADLVVEVGGADTIAQSMRATRADGTMSLIGNVGGSIAEINLPLVFMFRKRMIGISTGSVADFTAMMADLKGRPDFHPALDDHVYDFDGLGDALRALPKGAHFGKVAVRVS
ncbi:MAG: NAD(P)-dependent alcohol dehydrogenase [Alphaproteobacteria bacterium]|nr:NAD(P)-dependent alcohol dehydrogenase [Alphaproteobacteria bacterium]